MSILIATFPETREIAKRVAHSLKASYTEIKSEQFPDSEYHLSLREDPRNKTVVIISSMAHKPDEKMVETILAAGIARDYKADKVILVATYFPYLRQDTHFLKYDSFSSKYIFKLFSIFDRIITIDPHLHRIHNMHDLSVKAESISANTLIARYIKQRFKDNFTIIGPDEESAQWSQIIANMLGKKVYILTKHRSSATKIKQNEISAKLKGNAIIIDDIISTGKTLAGALALAREHGAERLYCIGIHGLLVGNAEKLIKKHAELITTNTIPNAYAKIDVSPIIVESIRKLV